MNVRVFVIVPCLVLHEHEKEIVLDRHNAFIVKGLNIFLIFTSREFTLANPVQ